MKKTEFKFNEHEIAFVFNPLNQSVMVNATQMAKIFNKKTELFLKSDHAKSFIRIANLQPNGGRIIEERGRNGIYFDRRLALKFAAWLSPEFEYWVYSTIDTLLFGNYRKHWEAHAREESLRIELNERKQQILLNPTAESVASYFELERSISDARQDKSKAIRNQLKLFADMKEN